MRFALLATMLIGVAIGCAVPTGRAAPPAAIATPALVAAAKKPARPDLPTETVLQRRDSGHFSTTAEVNGEAVTFVVDTGADIVALTVEDARRAHVAFDPAQFGPVARGASGEVRGQRVRLDGIVVGGTRVDDVGALVIEGVPVSLLGQNVLRHLTVEISGDTMRLR